LPDTQEIPVTIARFARYPLIAGALVISTAAHAGTPKGIISSWQEYMIRSVENLEPQRRENYMMKLTTDAKKDLDQVPCLKEQDAQDTVALVKTAAENINKAIARFSVKMGYGYIPRCDAPNAKNERKLKVDFVFHGLEKVAGGVPPEAKLVAANLERIKHAVELWGDMAKKAINETHDAQKTKAEVDGATYAAVKVISLVPCERTAEADIEDLVAKEVKKRGFDMDVNASGECDAQKHMWKVNFTVKAVRIPYDAARDAKGVNFSQGAAADLIIDDFFSKAKTFIDPKTVSWQRFMEQIPAFKDKVAGYMGQLNKITCGPSDKVAEYVQSEITKKASGAKAYIKINSVRAACNGGRVAVALDAEPVHP